MSAEGEKSGRDYVGFGFLANQSKGHIKLRPCLEKGLFAMANIG